MTDPLTCRQAFDRLEEFLDRELSSEETLRVVDHFEHCANCAREFRFEAGILEGVRSRLRRIKVPAELLASAVLVVRGRLPQRRRAFADPLLDGRAPAEVPSAPGRFANPSGNPPRVQPARHRGRAVGARYRHRQLFRGKLVGSFRHRLLPARHAAHQRIRPPHRALGPCRPGAAPRSVLSVGSGLGGRHSALCRASPSGHPPRPVVRHAPRADPRPAPP